MGGSPHTTITQRRRARHLHALHMLGSQRRGRTIGETGSKQAHWMQLRHERADVSKARGRMIPPTGPRRLAHKRVPCSSGALRGRAKSLAKQRRANREGDYTDGLVAVDAGRCLPREGMQRPLARQARQAAGFLPPCRGGKRLTNPGQFLAGRPEEVGFASTRHSAPRKRDGSLTVS
jgi:hypothetical protein